MIAFAIGSLFPQIKGSEPYTSWADETEKTLNLIPSIRDLEVRGGRERFSLFGLHEEVDDGSLIRHPIPQHGRISFILNVPARVQSRLNPWGDISAGNGIEDFLVVTELDRDYPYTYVLISGTAEILKPSGAVVVVREFLKEEIDKLGDRSTVRLTALGPSPFHAEFYIQPGNLGEKAAPGLGVARTHSRWYDRLDFYFDEEIAGPAQAMEEISKQFGPEFATYYLLTAEGVIKQRKMESLTDDTEEAVSAYTRKGLKNWLRRLLTSRANLRNLSLEMLRIQMSITRTQQSNNETLEGLKEGREFLLLGRELKEVSELNYANELENSGAILKVLESQHTQTVQRVTAFAVSLLGVMVGAFLTAALRR
ncbi:hypothetical protein [Streptomyces sp. NBC_01750]|uniref:hypothetical protein n=1 Tax=Streptomyces sp. NBC_01750 TaxID=2975928 RepID=UPI002DD999EF|nr:hypothetical protein [Streptomyces sp. NBC_01750]WSD35347.1 hypothetical protein OG966_27715 [Streptomyces sp. NBC_01750]